MAPCAILQNFEASSFGWVSEKGPKCTVVWRSLFQNIFHYYCHNSLLLWRTTNLLGMRSQFFRLPRNNVCNSNIYSARGGGGEWSSYSQIFSFYGPMILLRQILKHLEERLSSYLPLLLLPWQRNDISENCLLEGTCNECPFGILLCNYATAIVSYSLVLILTSIKSSPAPLLTQQAAGIGYRDLWKLFCNSL